MTKQLFHMIRIHPPLAAILQQQQQMIIRICLIFIIFIYNYRLCDEFADFVTANIW